ncbi:UBA-like_superfamily [Hexamita inflata]|uniref:UBA-like superfamily n=1 Tax=Hexamita inflata TaxID=28002 RepID=A0AA86R5R5_9EUKA|nr:UBA-like superfamily [Hexamita inflata]
MNEYQKIQSFNDITQCSVEQATRFLKQNNYNVEAAMDAFYESGEEPENAVPIEKPQPSEFAIKQMMDSTSTSSEQAIRYLQNCYNSVPEAINKFIDSGEEPKGQIVKQPEKHISLQLSVNSSENNYQQNYYNNFDNVEDDNDYNTNQSQKSKSKQPVQKENKQVKSFFNGANNQVRFQETMNVSFDIANKYINAAGGDYDKAVQLYQEDQVRMQQPVQKENKQVKSFFTGANNQVRFQETMNVSFDIANKYINAAGGDYDKAVQQYQKDCIKNQQSQKNSQKPLNQYNRYNNLDNNEYFSNTNQSQSHISQQLSVNSSENNYQQNYYNNFDNVEDDNDYNTNQSQKSKSKQPVQKENKQVKSFFNGANNQVRFQETMNVSFDIANKYISAAGGDYDKAVQLYQEDQVRMQQPVQKENKQVKSFFTGANNQVRFQETMNVSFDIANKYISAAGGDYDKAVQLYQEDQVRMQQPVQKENKQVKSFFTGANNQVRFQETMNVSFDIANKYISAAGGDYEKAVQLYQKDCIKNQQSQKNSQKPLNQYNRYNNLDNNEYFSNTNQSQSHISQQLSVNSSENNYQQNYYNNFDNVEDDNDYNTNQSQKSKSKQPVQKENKQVKSFFTGANNQVRFQETMNVSFDIANKYISAAGGDYEKAVQLYQKDCIKNQQSQKNSQKPLNQYNRYNNLDNNEYFSNTNQSQSHISQQLSVNSSENNYQQNYYNNFDNVEDDNDYNTNQSQKSKSKQPVQKENKQVKSFFNGANNQVRFQETMNVSFDIANKYINAAGGDYDKAVQLYQEDQVRMQQPVQKENKQVKSFFTGANNQVRFQETMNVSLDIANKYISAAGGDYEKAIKQYQEDQAQNQYTWKQHLQQFTINYFKQNIDPNQYNGYNQNQLYKKLNQSPQVQQFANSSQFEDYCPNNPYFGQIPTQHINQLNIEQKTVSEHQTFLEDLNNLCIKHEKEELIQKTSNSQQQNNTQEFQVLSIQNNSANELKNLNKNQKPVIIEQIPSIYQPILVDDIYYQRMLNSAKVTNFDQEHHQIKTYINEIICPGQIKDNQELVEIFQRAYNILLQVTKQNVFTDDSFESKISYISLAKHNQDEYSIFKISEQDPFKLLEQTANFINQNLYEEDLRLPIDQRALLFSYKMILEEEESFDLIDQNGLNMEKIRQHSLDDITLQQLLKIYENRTKKNNIHEMMIK